MLGRWNTLSATCFYRKLLHFNIQDWAYGLCLKHLFPRGNKIISSVWCPKASLQPKGFRTFQISPLVCQLPAVSRDRGLSEATFSGFFFLFEAIQLVTCETTSRFLNASDVIQSPFFFLRQIFLLSSNNSPYHLVWELSFFFFVPQQTVFVDMQKMRHVGEWWDVMAAVSEVSGCLNSLHMSPGAASFL